MKLVENELLHFLKNNKLPGWDAQVKMSPSPTSNYLRNPSNPKVAAVLVLLYKSADQWYISYIKRSTKKSDKHAGQISFPGGKYEESDADLLSCALREANEEIGIDSEKVKIIGELSPLYVWVSDFMIHPFMGYLDERPVFSKQDSEVERVVEVALGDLLNHSSKKNTEITVRNITLQEVPCFDVNDELIWGATAMITNEFLEIIDHLDYNPQAIIS